MRFLRYGDTGDLGFITFDDEPIPAYAILSHTWGADTEEVTFEDLIRIFACAQNRLQEMD